MIPLNGNEELLNYVYQNCQMGEDTMNRMISMTHDDKFKNHLYAQMNDYHEMNERADQLLRHNGAVAKNVPAMEKFTAYMMIDFKTALDRSTPHLAEMLIQGSTMGIVDAEKNLRTYPHAESEIRSLCTDLLHMEQNNIENLKPFLA